VTVNRNHVADPEAIYDEFRSRGIHMKVNPLTRSGLADTPQGADLGITAEEYGEFLVRLFDAWFDDPEPTISIEPFVQHISRILGVGVAHSCFYTLSCHHFFLAISPDGDLFPCGYGNIHEMEPEDVAQTVLFGGIEAREKKVLEDCSKCAFFDLCYSGCMFHSLKDSKILAEKDYYCAGYKMYFAHACGVCTATSCKRFALRPYPATAAWVEHFLAVPGRDALVDGSRPSDPRHDFFPAANRPPPGEPASAFPDCVGAQGTG
jgi:uncharacterized protein